MPLTAHRCTQIQRGRKAFATLTEERNFSHVGVCGLLHESLVAGIIDVVDEWLRGHGSCASHRRIVAAVEFNKATYGGRNLNSFKATEICRALLLAADLTEAMVVVVTAATHRFSHLTIGPARLVTALSPTFQRSSLAPKRHESRERREVRPHDIGVVRRGSAVEIRLYVLRQAGNVSVLSKQAGDLPELNQQSQQVSAVVLRVRALT